MEKIIAVTAESHDDTVTTQSSDAQTAATDSHATTATTEQSGGIGAATQALGINGVGLIGQILNFVILAFLLQRFLYKPLVGLLEQRREQIETSLTKAEEMEKRYAEFEIEHEKRINKSKEDATALLQKAKQAAEDLRQETLATTQAESDRLLARAEQEIEQQKLKLMAELKSEIGGLVVAATGKIMAKEIDEKSNQKLIDEALAEVKQ